MISLTSSIETSAHHWPAGRKLAALCLVSTILFFFDDPKVQLAALCVTLGLYAAPGVVFLRAGLRSLRLILPFVVVLVVWHIFTDDLRTGATITLRMITLLALANLLTMTTKLSDLSELVRTLTAPLRNLGLPVHFLELAMPLAIRFTPVLLAKATTIAEASRARTSRRRGAHLILPLMLQALDDAEQVSEALRARGNSLKSYTKE
jgi:biotin transport system permease protein